MSFRPLVALPLLLVIGGLAYATSWQGVFVFDDLSAIVGNTAWDDWSRGLQALRHSQRWFGDLTFLANVQGFGREPWGFHAVNLAIHLLTGCGIYLVATQLLSLPVCDSSAAPWNIAAADRDAWCQRLACVCAAVWLVHPLTTQGVTYIVQRYEQLAACGIVWSLWFYARAESPSTGWRNALLASLCTVLALGTKQTGVTVPLLTLLWERLPLQQPFMQRLRARGLYYLLVLPGVVSAVGSALPTSARHAVTETRDGPASDAALPLVERENFAGFDYRAVSSWEYLRSQGGVLCHYLRLSLFPDRLCFDYGWPVAESPWDWVPSCLVIVGLLCLGAVLWWQGSPGGFVLLASFVVLGPTSSILPIRDLAVEHRAYLPLACWVGLLVVGGSWLLARCVSSPQRRTVWGTVCVVLVLSVLSVRTLWRNCDYHSAVRLWEQTTRTAPLNPRAFYNLGHELLQVGRADDAIPPLKTALQLSELPQNRRFLTANELADNHNRLGTAYHQQGDIGQALEEYDRARKWNPQSGLAHHNRANALALLQRWEAASAAYQRAAELLPSDARVQLDWGNLHAMQENFAAAVELYDAALQRDPRLVDALINRGTALATLGRTDASRRDLESAGRLLAPGDPRREVVVDWLELLKERPRLRSVGE